MKPGTLLALSAVLVVPFAADNFELPRQLLLAGGAALLLWRGSFVPRGAALWGGALVGVALLSTLTSLSRATSLPALVTTVALGSFALASGGVSFRPVLVVAWPIAGYALVQRLGADPVVWSTAARWCGEARPTGTMGHATQLGLWMALVVPLALEEARRAAGLLRAFGLATAGVAMGACVLSLSRAGWLALAVGALAWMLQRGSSRRVWAGAGVVVVAAALVSGPALVDRITHFFVAPTRLGLWKAALVGSSQRPLLGWGLDTFVLVAQQFRGPEEWQYEWGGTAQHAHSLLPQVLATQGALGLFVYLAAGAWLLRTLWRGRVDTEQQVGAASAGLGFLAGEAVAFSGVAVSALGLACLVAAVARTPAWRLPRWSSALAASAAVVSALVLVASVQARLAMLSEGAAAERGFLAAAHFEPWNAVWHARRGLVLERQVATEPEALARARSAYEAAREVEPLVAQYDSNVGRVAALQGDGPASTAAFERALGRAPLDGRIALDAAEAALRLGQLERADALLLRLLGHYPFYGPAFWVLAALRGSQGRPVEERAALEAALGADWRDWPEGQEHARLRLAVVLAEAGDLEAARARLSRPVTGSAPADICGAPVRLGR